MHYKPFTGLGPAGTLEASNNNLTDQVPPFLKAIFDTFFEDFENAEGLKVLTDNVYLVRLIYQYSFPPAWTRARLFVLYSSAAYLETFVDGFLNSTKRLACVPKTSIWLTTFLIV